MPNIDNYTQAIEDAVYGEEVRSAIVDALLAMNASADNAEMWATGGEGGTPTSDNNAKYYAEQAAESAQTLVIDPTLTEEGKAADAAAVGARFGLITETSSNLYADGDVEITSSSGIKNFALTNELPGNKTYTMSASNITTYAGSSDITVTLHSVTSSMSPSNLLATLHFPKNSRGSVTFTIANGSTAKGIRFYAGSSIDASEGKTATYSDIQIEEGSTATTYKPHLTAKDVVARGATLESTGDSTDRTSDILAMLNLYKTCKLGMGDFYVKNLVMPDGTSLYGSGDGTRVFMADSADGVAIMMQSRCTVADLTVLGATDNITLGDAFAGHAGDISQLTNLMPSAYRSVTTDATSGYSQYYFDSAYSLPAGEYAVSASISAVGEEPSGNSVIYFSTSTGGGIGANTIVAELAMPVGRESVGYVYLPKDVHAFRITSRESSSAGHQVTWSSIKISALSSRSGIGWVQMEEDHPLERGLISNCRIARFECAGIYAADTGTAVYRNLLVTNTFAYNCNVGLYLRKNSEFNKISNCSFSRCQYGAISRCGNNGFNNCSFDSNSAVNLQFDSDEGGNGGHSMVSNCTIVHAGGDHDNPTYALVIKTTDGGRIHITNCTFGFGKTLIENSQGNILSNCGYGRNASVEVSGGKCSMFTNCFTIDSGSSGTVFRRTNGNTLAKLINVFARGTGESINWTVD